MCIEPASFSVARTGLKADELIRNACAAQDPDGFWPEHQGPTVGYNIVYLHAFGLYHFHGGSSVE